jgi:hypothetical protein
MARKPDGKSIGTDRVTFTRGAADRIARVVRSVEAGDRDQGGVEFGYRAAPASSKTFRVATFSGAWAKNSSKVVTFAYQSTTPNTASASNLLWSSAGATASTTTCVIGRDGTAWYLIAPEVDAPSSRAFTVVTDATLTTSGILLTRLSVQVACVTATASSVVIPVTECS